MKWDRTGSSYFLVFDCESAVSVRSEHQEKWDKFIPEKNHGRAHPTLLSILISKRLVIFSILY
jgi:hypothetical protein